MRTHVVPVFLLPPSMAERTRFCGYVENLETDADLADVKLPFPPREDRVRPVVLAYSLGKSQESIQQLVSRGLAVTAHEAIFQVSALYGSLGVPIDARCFDGAFRDQEVGVFPPFAKYRPRDVGALTTAVLTGWALEPWGARRAGADVAFPVSDHADFPALIEFAKRTGAREVVTLFGFAEELAAGLRKEGVFARAVSERLQLDFFGAPITHGKPKPKRR